MRDGRDTGLSIVKKNFGSRTIFAAATYWKKCVLAGLRAEKEIPATQLMKIHYEDLLSDTEKVMRRICAFLEVPFDRAVCTPTVIRLRYRKPYFRKVPASYNHSGAVVSHNVQKWKDEMIHTERVVFESVAGDLLEELGYETLGLERVLSPAEILKYRLHEYWGQFMMHLLNNQKNKWLWTELQMRWVSRLAEKREKSLQKFSVSKLNDG